LIRGDQDEGIPNGDIVFVDGFLVNNHLGITRRSITFRHAGGFAYIILLRIKRSEGGRPAAGLKSFRIFIGCHNSLATANIDRFHLWVIDDSLADIFTDTFATLCWAYRSIDAVE